MLIYNTSFHVDGEALIGPFLTYMRDYYLPAATARGYLRNPRLMRLLTDVGEGLFGYALMCECDSAADLKRWKQEIEDVLLSSFRDRFGERILTFSTTMTVIKTD